MIERKAAAIVLGHRVSAKDLADMAVRLLAAGHETPAVVRLASVDSTDEEDAVAMLESIMIEVGIAPPSRRDAALILGRDIARQMTTGEIEPYEGGKRIWQLGLDANQIVLEFDPFVYASSEWEDRPGDRAFFEQALLQAATDLLNEDA